MLQYVRQAMATAREKSKPVPVLIAGTNRAELQPEAAVLIFGQAVSIAIFHTIIASMILLLYLNWWWRWGRLWRCNDPTWVHRSC